MNKDLHDLALGIFEQESDSFNVPSNADEFYDYAQNLRIKQIELELKLKKGYDLDGHYKKLIDRLPLGVAIHQKGKVIYANSNGLHTLGATSLKDILGRNILDFVHAESIPVVMERMMQVTRGADLPPIEEKLVRLDGSVFDAEVSAFKLVHKGEPAGQVLIKDITHQKQIETELIRSEEKYRNLIEFAPDAFLQANEEGRCIYVNRKAIELTGYGMSELLGMHVSGFFSYTELEASPLRFDELALGKAIIRERKIITKSGRILTVEMNSSKNPDGTYQSFVRDVSDRIHAEEELVKNNQLFKKLMAHLPGVVFQLHKNSNGKFAVPLASEGLYDIFELYHKDVVNNAGMIFDRIHPADYRRMIERIEQSAEALSLLHEEYRVVLPTKGIQWLLCTAMPEKQDNGGVLWQGVILNITARKEVEHKLADERILLRTIIDNLPDAIYAKDLKGRKLFSNRVDIQNQGLISETQVIGKTDFEIFPEKLARKFWEIDRKVIESGEAIVNHKDEFIFEDNQEHWLVSSKYPLRNEQDEVIGLVGISRDITQKVLAEQKIIQLSKGVEQSPASIVITNLEGDIEYVNSKFIALTGYDYEEVKGKNPRILSSGEKSADEYKLLWDTISHGDEWKGEFHNKKKNGELYWESAIISPIRDEQGTIHSYIAIKEDITHRKHTEQQLLKLNAGMNQSPASIIIINTKGFIEYVNKKFIETSGYTKAELTGRMLRILKPGHTDRDVYDNIWSNLNEGLEWRGEHLNRRKNGDRYWESVLISPIKNSDNKIINFIAIMEDISLRKSMEVDLRNAKEKAEESDRLKSAFLNNMSHEIRTPLNAIVGFSELFSNDDLSVEEREYFYDIMQNSSDQLLHIISDIINVSTIDAGQISAQLVSCNLNDLLVTIFEQFRVSNKNKNIKITYVSTLNDVEAKIITDETKLNQTLTNLIVNALKFTEEGFVEFGVKKDDDKLQFWVKDSGIGISAEYQEIIFERFRQANTSISKIYGGSGLGLSIAKSFVQLLGGEISVNSSPGKGAVFAFYLPYRQG